MNTSLPSDHGATGTPQGSALRHPASQVVFWGTAVGVLALDLWSKAWAFAALGPHEDRVIVRGLLLFRRSLNDGAVFGSFTGYVGVFIAASIAALLFVLFLFWRSHPRQWALHLALGLILAGALGNLYDRATVQADVVRVPRGDAWDTAIIGVVREDSTEQTLRVGVFPEGTPAQSFPRDEVRVHRQGVVRDFIKFVPRFPDWVPVLNGRDVWPWVFNVADSALVCGVILMLVGTWVEEARAARRRRGSPANAEEQMRNAECKVQNAK